MNSRTVTPGISMRLRAVAIVPSAGLGRRFGKDRNKPFEMLGSKPVLIWAIETLESMPEITEIIPVLKEADMQTGEELFSRHTINKVKRIAQGGKERQDSVYNGLKHMEDRRSAVLVHDGARPFLRAETVRKALDALPGYDGVVIGVTPKDTIKETGGDIISRTLDRDSLIAVQTPQVFYYEPLMDAHEKAQKQSFYGTDDAALVERYGGRIKVVKGEYTNIKITTPEDLVIAEALLAMEGRGA